jgi:gamma-glutamyl-gamma-aminobutyrate hydrolase PuuD
MRPIIGISAHQSLVGDGEVQTIHEVVSVAYVKAVRKAGGVPLLLPVVDPDDAAGLLERVDGLLMTGGGDVDPASYGADEVDPRTSGVDASRDARDIALCRTAVERDIPTLAICRGSQVLNVALGGTLHQHVDKHFEISRYNELVHDVDIEASSTLATWLGATSLGVNTLHHQATATVGPDARIVARADDGTIEGVEAIGVRAVGVQWHPEMLRHRPEHLVLFESLVRLGAGNA